MLELFEKPERAEFDSPQPAPIEEMKNDGDGCSRKAEEDKRIEEIHGNRVHSKWKKGDRNATCTPGSAETSRVTGALAFAFRTSNRYFCVTVLRDSA